MNVKLKRNRIMRLDIPVSAPFEELIDWKHPLLRRAAGATPEERLLNAWRKKQGYRWFFERKDLKRLIRELSPGSVKGGVALGKMFLKKQPYCHTTGNRKRNIKLDPKSRLSTAPNAVSIDWHEYDQQDVEWMYSVNRHAYLPPMAAAARRTGREDIAERVFELMEHWVVNNPCTREDQITEKFSRWGPHWKSTWQMLNCGLRIQNWLRVLHVLWDSTLLTPERFAAYVRSMRQQSLVVGRTTPAMDPGANGNHMLMETEALLYWAALPWTREARNARDVGVHNLARCLQVQVLPDGGHAERVPGYHMTCIHCFINPILLCRLNKWPLPREAERRATGMVEFAPYVTMPDRGVANFGDCSDGSPEAILALGETATGLKMPWKLPTGTRPELLSIPKIPRRKKNWPLAAAFPDVGYASARTGWSVKDSAVVMHACGFGGGHSHSDWLSVLYTYRGRRIITERGVNTYNPDHDNMLFRLGRAHNILQIGDRDAVVHETSMWEKYVNADGRLLEFKAGKNGGAGWTGEMRFLDGTTWTRRVDFFPTGKLVLTDKLCGPRQSRTELRFHLNTMNAKLLSPTECVTTDKKMPNVKIAVEGPEGLEGTLSPVGLSPSFTKRTRGLLLCLTCAARPRGTWVTTIRGAAR